MVSLLATEMAPRITPKGNGLENRMTRSISVKNWWQKKLVIKNREYLATEIHRK